MRFRRFYSVVETILLLSATVLLLCFPARASSYACAGVELCLRAVIPALFPFFVLNALFLALGLPQRLSRFLSPLFSRLFGISGAGAAVFLLGLVSGYPVGASAVAALYRDGGCSREEAERLLGYANNCGPGFLLGVLGGQVFHSLRPALCLYAIHLAVSVWLGVLLGSNAQGGSSPPPAPAPRQRFASAFPTAIRSGGEAVLQVCAYVIFFSVPLRFLPELPLLRGFVELTGGITALRGWSPQNAAAAAFLLGWGGLSVYCQVLRFAQEAGLRTGFYALSRLIHGLFSASLVWLLFTRPILLPFPLGLVMMSVFFSKFHRKNKGFRGMMRRKSPQHSHLR